MESTVQTLYDRVDRLGISEANISTEGENQIRVQLAGVEDQTEAREMLATSARLSFRDVHDEEHLDGSDVREGSAKQDFNPETNEIGRASCRESAGICSCSERVNAQK